MFWNISGVSSNKIEILFMDHVVQTEHFFQHYIYILQTKLFTIRENDQVPKFISLNFAIFWS